jgi:two-component system response regulator
MLVLTRNRETGVHIGDDITVRVLSITRRTVKLGIEAPRSVQVRRDELAPMYRDDPAGSSPGWSKRAAGMKIVLVVEDDPGHARLIRGALCQSQGTMVTVTGTARGALDALGTRAGNVEHIVRPDLILLDLGLPDGSGLEVLRTIRSVPQLRTVPVVVLSCRDDETAMQQCLSSGANAFVVKSANSGDMHALAGRIGQFWTDDCFMRHGFGQRGVDPATFQTGNAPVAVDADKRERLLAASERGRRILLADDDLGHITLIKRALRRAGIECVVDVVHNGLEALNYLLGVGDVACCRPAEMPDLFFLDLNMPDMDGRQVLQVLRNVRRETRVNLPPVVVLSASDNDTDINDSYNLGAQSFIRKPVDHGRFTDAVQQTTRYWLGLNEMPSHRRQDERAAPKHRPGRGRPVVPPRIRTPQ